MDVGPVGVVGPFVSTVVGPVGVVGPEGSQMPVAGKGMNSRADVVSFLGE